MPGSRRIARDLVDIDAEESGVQLKGLIGKPGVSRSTRQEMITLVNGRPVDSRVLYYALIESYHTFIPKGRYPLAFLLINIDPAAVDVNVHPAKREVRFRNDGDLRRFVMESVIQVLRKLGDAENAWVDAAEKVEPVQAPAIPKPVIPEKTQFRDPSETPKVSLPAPITRSEPLVSVSSAILAKPKQDSESEEEEKVRVGAQVMSTWTWKGVFADRYALFETKSGLLVLYPPRARIRILYERVLSGFKDRELASQGLLIPLSLDLAPVTAQMLADQSGLLKSAGFGVEEFGRNFYRITSHPNWLEDSEVEPFINELLHRLQDGDMRLDEKKHDLATEALARFASRFRAGRSGESAVNQQAMELLLDALFDCENPLTDPEGNPTYVELTHREFRQRFGF